MRLRGRWMLGVSFLLSLSLWALVPPRIQSDGVGYYAYLRSAFFDHDLDFRNEYTHYRDVSSAIQFVDEQRLTPTGKVANVWAVGPAVLWSPFFLLGHLTARVLVACGTRTGLDGYSAPYVVAISFASCLYAWAGLLAYRICREYMDRGTSCLALLVVWFGTSLPAYMYFYPSMGHATSFFSVSLFLFAWHATRGQKTSIRWMLLGVLAGLMTMVRWQNCLFGIVAAFDLVPGPAGRIHKKNWKEAWMAVANGAGFLACAALAFSPQMLAWKSLYGQLLTFPFDPGGTSTHFHWMEHVSDVLFSSKHGLLTWTPAVSIALAGLPLFAREDEMFALSLTCAFLL